MLSSAIDDSTASSKGASPPQTNSRYFYRLPVRAIQQETRDAITIVFDIPPEFEGKFRFVQGQYLTLRARIDGVEVRRSYSICSAVQDALLRVAIKRTPGGIFSNWMIENVKPGDLLEVMPPEGRFHVALSPAHNKDYVAFAAGSGITPVLSIIRTTLFTEPNSSFTLFYGNRASSTTMFREELAELKDRFMQRFSLVHIMTREHQDVDLLNGRITAEKSELLLKQFCRFENIDTAFLCGPEQMVDEVSERLKMLGFPESRIKIELFTVNESERRTRIKATATHSTAECQVTLIVDGGRQNFSMPKEANILDAALQHGIDLRHSCKSGVCATCRSKLIEGQVDMDANYALEDYEIARGFVLTCQSYPASDHVTLDFDQDN